MHHDTRSTATTRVTSLSPRHIRGQTTTFPSTCTPPIHIQPGKAPAACPISSSHSIVARRAAFLCCLSFAVQPLIVCSFTVIPLVLVGISSPAQHTSAPISRVQHARIVSRPPPFLFHLSPPATPPRGSITTPLSDRRARRIDRHDAQHVLATTRFFRAPGKDPQQLACEARCDMLTYSASLRRILPP